jgi:hypothetical protein
MAKQAANSGKDWTARIGLIISLVMSAIALWLSALAPPDIKAIVSSPVLRWQGETEVPPDIPGAKRSTAPLMMKATCAFSNNGAQTGEISLLALRFEADDGTNWIASPLWTVDDAKLAMEQKIEAKGSFVPIVLPGKQTISYSYLFSIEPSSASEKIILAPHRFHVSLFTWSPGHSEPHKQQTSTLSMDSYVVTALRSGQFFEVPFEEERAQMQTILKK